MQVTKQVGLVFFPAFDWAISPSHPEREERLLYTRDQIVEEGLLDLPSIVDFRPEIATTAQINRAHVVVPNVDVQVGESHRIAAGGGIRAANAVLNGEVNRAFALVRPPGHHAMRFIHGSRGFCVVNNEAIMVEHIRAQKKGKVKIAIIDTDAHHGDGTQDIYYNDPGILHISLHQDGRTLYPGTGDVNELGGPGAYGNTINVPLPPGTGDEGILYVLEKLVRPILHDWQPDIVVNAAGQDNHFSDPLTNMQVSAAGYAKLTELLNPDIVVLEGGYSVESALPYVNVGILLALAGLDYSKVKEPTGEQGKQTKAVSEHIAKTVHVLQEVWARREEVDREEIFGSGRFFERERMIYYDTDNIYESQQERIRLCPSCAGWRLISSVSDRYQDPVCAGILGWDNCPTCLREAREQYEEVQNSHAFAQTILVDPLADPLNLSKP